MAKTNRRILPFGTYAAGSYALPSVNTGQASSQFEIAIDRSALPDTTDIVADIRIEGSDDNGATWQGLGGITLSGGAALDKQGTPLLESIYSAAFDNSKPGNYRLRGTAVLFQELTTGLRLTVY
jgi:hypothetical protein